MEAEYVALGALMFAVLVILGTAALGRLASIEARLTIANRTEQKLDLLLQHFGVKYDPYANVLPEVVEALQQSQKIKAIKLYRQYSGTSLKEAKDFIEELQRRTGLA